MVIVDHFLNGVSNGLPNGLQHGVFFVLNENTSDQSISPACLLLSEVQYEIKNSKSGKSPAYEQITVGIQKHLSSKLLRQVTTFFSSLLRINVFLRTWKIARVILVQKAAKDPNDITQTDKIYK